MLGDRAQLSCHFTRSHPSTIIYHNRWQFLSSYLVSTHQEK
uniref:Uncharacterized protein n=1 Tax=Arundo donax TaxID=35708 RepID=A0A0A9GE30_ARUDO